MITRNIEVVIEEYESSEQLNSEEQLLLQQAEEATHRAYAPYSLFRVGAAVLLDDGEVITGNNQENVSYPTGLCAERVALFYANSKFPDKKVVTVAVAARSEDFEVTDPVTPCGACRQAIAEYEGLAGHPIRILMKGDSKKVIAVNGIKQLLPMLFYAEELKKK